MMIIEGFFELAFSLLIRFMRQSARLLFERASEQESCLFFLFDPGVLPGNTALTETVAHPSQMLSDFFPDINLRAIDTVSKIITDLLRLRYGSFLSPSTLSEGKSYFCYRLID